ncbi:hypothetical protein JL722_4064 [Aureococcus anophagefferens]|nr:hypothetical protein JL722_4064 [Aureococcus anophagefferens]
MRRIASESPHASASSSVFLRSVVGSELVASGPAYGPAPRRVRIVGVEDVAIQRPAARRATAPAPDARDPRVDAPRRRHRGPDEADELSGAHVADARPDGGLEAISPSLEAATFAMWRRATAPRGRRGTRARR